MSQQFSDFDDRISIAYPIISIAFSRFMLDTQRRVMVELGLDLESSYIWGTLAQYNLSGVVQPTIDPKKLIWTQFGMRGLMKPARLTDISEVSRLPVETVRRKLKVLATQNRVEQLPDKTWLGVVGGDAYSQEFVKDSIRRMLDVADLMVQVMQRVK